MSKQVLIAGGGIAGMAAALGASHAGWDVRVFERAAAFSEVGAGVQLGPNVVRRLQAWGLQGALQAVGFAPQQLQARSAGHGGVLASLPLGADMVQRYGAAYLTLHRADLHQLLYTAAAQRGEVYVNPGQAVLELQAQDRVVTIRTTQQPCVEGDALLLADGVWSQLRAQVLADASRPRVTGHLAYRALLPMAQVPQALRAAQVTVWLGPQLHVVHYPVRGGEWLNVIVMLEGPVPDDVEHWDHAGNTEVLQRALTGSCRAFTN